CRHILTTHGNPRNPTEAYSRRRCPDTGAAPVSERGGDDEHHHTHAGTSIRHAATPAERQHRGALHRTGRAQALPHVRPQSGGERRTRGGGGGGGAAGPGGRGPRRGGAPSPGGEQSRGSAGEGVAPRQVRGRPIRPRTAAHYRALLAEQLDPLGKYRLDAITA